ncbi:enoyl-CoA hydratase/isomerase family protein [Oceaniglobus ichthyenteri]|uniref:enoyl-CoA hydratase/isomerase family protein n=1 Tax=Oceaniglobus ichthyenteri TaxID=2136177 RepID=UPI0013DDF775|nr:enoyl-CoA hydratase-related protein [Oceaniglobus ichthyenteri]
MVTRSCADGVAVVTLSRPEKYNAITVGLRDALLGVLADIAADDTIRCVVLQAQGRAFCAGQDLGERAPIVQGTPIDLGKALEDGINRIILALADLPQPVIAAVQGRAIGAGASLALACDLMVCSADASLHFSFAKLGLVPDSGASWFLQRRLGHGRAAKALLLSEPITAQMALDMGLAADLADTPEGAQTLARDMAKTIAAAPAPAISATKELLHGANVNELATQLRAEAKHQTKAGHSSAYRQALERFLTR